jgi:hypothetical protein
VKFLTICEGGIVRSVAMASVLRWDFGQDALPASGAKTPDDTLLMLADWADRIVVLEPRYVERIVKKHVSKIRVEDVGPDIWRNPFHPALVDKMGGIVQGWKDAGWKL